MKKKILVVEDDPSLGFVIKDNLEEHGWEVEVAEDGQKGQRMFDTKSFDLCLLDVMLPKMDGFSLAEYIRNKDKQVPLLFLTAKSMTEDKLKGFRLGADDYITKPFHIEELLHKIEVFLKRSAIHSEEEAQPSASLSIGEYVLDFQNVTLVHANETKRLTAKEAQVLRYFFQKPGELIPRDKLLKEIWGKDDYFLGRSMDVFISRIRKYLRHDARILLENVHGIGFILKFNPS